MGRLRASEIVGLACALAFGLLAIFWPDVERVFKSRAGCPYLLAGGSNSHHETSARYLVFENGFVLMAGENGTRIDSRFIVDTETGRFTQQSASVRTSNATIDLHGAIVTPGFVDPHVHFLSSGLSLIDHVIDVRDARNGDELQERIKLATDGRGDREWAIAYGFQHEFGGASWLSDISAPTVVFRFDSHQLLANAKALELAEITPRTAEPEGGAIIRDAQGMPTGVLCDAAMGLLTRVIPPLSEEVLREAFLASEIHALRKGVTTVHDMGRVSFDDEFASFDDLQRIYVPGATNQRQKIRIEAFVSLKAHEPLKQLIDTLGSSFADGRLVIGGVKDFYDGSLSSKTALFVNPYNDDGGTNSGIRLVDPTAWEAMARAADGDGLRIATHAIGSKAVDEVLDVYEKLPNRHRHRIEHAQHVSSLKTIERMATLGIAGVTPNPQHWIHDREVIPKRLHEDDAKLSYPLSAFRKAGVTAGMASDWPVVKLDPLGALESAIDQRNPYAITAWEALYSITRGGQALSRHDLGLIADGMLADFVIHNAYCDEHDRAACPFEKAVSTLIRARDNDVERVYIAGKEVMRVNAVDSTKKEKPDHH